MKKKLLSLVLVSAMVLGSAITASATSSITDMAGTGTGTDVTGTSTVKVPTINITVPTSAAVVINPYKMTAQVGSDEINAQIATVPQEITNASDVKVAVNVENLKAVPSEGVAVSATSLATKTTGAKSVFLFLEMQPGAKDDAVFTEKYDAKAAMLACPAAAAGTAEEKIKGTSKAAIITLDEKDGTTTKASFKMGGDVIANPTKLDNKVTVADPWTSTDTVTFQFKFTFTPQVITE